MIKINDKEFLSILGSCNCNGSCSYLGLGGKNSGNAICDFKEESEIHEIHCGEPLASCPSF